MTTIRFKAAVLVYGLLAAAAIAWGFLRGNPDIFHHPGALLVPPLPLPVSLVLGGAAGITFGLGMAWLNRLSVYRFRWAREMHTEFRGLFGPLTGGAILFYAVFSSLGEELFFRGVLQPAIGIVPASLIFGLLHIAPGRKLLPWPLQAVAMGFAFGGLYWLSGDLSAPILAHFTINYQNLHFINGYDPSLQLPRVFNQERAQLNRR